MGLSSAKLILPLVLGLALVAPVGAQQQPSTTSPVATADARDQLAEAKAAIDSISEIERQISEVYDQAERSGDEAQEECVRKQLVAVRALLEICKGSYQSIQDFLADGDDARADYEYRKIKALLSKANQKQALANACFDQGGQGDVTVSVDNDGGEELIEEIESGNSDIGSDPPGTTPFE